MNLHPIYTIQIVSVSQCCIAKDMYLKIKFNYLNDFNDNRWLQDVKIKVL